MTRQILFKRIISLYGPQGPVNISDDVWEADKNNWVKNHSEEIIESFISLVIDPPKITDFNHPSHADGFEVGMWEIAKFLGKYGNADEILEHLLPAFKNPLTRINTIVIIGELKSEKGLELFSGIIDEELSAETWSYLMHAVTEIAGEKALKLLNQIESRIPKANHELQMQLTDAIKIVGSQN